MFRSGKQRSDAAAEDWGDLSSFAVLMAASLEVLDPAPTFRWELRERLVAAAAQDIARHEAAAAQRSPVLRGVLVGAGAAAAAAAAGAILVFWRRNPHAIGQLLHARGA